MSLYTVDLHNHSPLIPNDYRGDPATTPRQIVERCLERGIDVWGVADHFCVDYGPRLVAAADEVARETGRRLLVVPGAEIRVRHLGEETHLIALFPPTLVHVRFRSLLGALGLPDPVAPLAELPGVATDRDPCHVARMVERFGGICHVGHVDRTFGDYRFIDSELVHELADCEAVSAIELIDHSERGRLRNGLPVAHISSSDSHSLDEIGRRTTVLEMRELSFDALRDALREKRRTGAAG
jgi:PHP family Zn ribbon phosphoesterase